MLESMEMESGNVWGAFGRITNFTKHVRTEVKHPYRVNLNHVCLLRVGIRKICGLAVIVKAFEAKPWKIDLSVMLLKVEL